jgi:serine/threonine-protein kinase
MDPVAESADRLLGVTLANRYQIETKLGEGAMGAVYRARHVKVGRPFAVKVLHPRLLEDDKVLQRFEREAELAGRLHHPNVIGVVDVGETHGLRYMVMDFAEGPDLSSLLSEAPMPPARIIHLVRQMLEGLYHAHEAGLIHRDFKPENVIIEKDTHGDEVPRIVDFGIAILREGGDSSSGPGRLTTNGLVLGTPHYMAPEQAVNDPIDHRIDLFALGIMIYEMLCGRLPFDGTGAEVARANLLLDPPVISDRVPYLDVDPLLEAFSRRLMAKRRDLRPATAKAARDLLELIAKDREAAAAALGVPLAVRTPRTTQPVQPRHVGDYPGTFPPPLREVETPPQAPAMASALAQPSAERGVTTAPAEPLPFEAEPVARTRRMPLVAGALALIAIVVVAIVAANRSSHDDGNASGSNAVVMQSEHPVVTPPPVAPPPVAPPPVADTGSAAAGSAVAVVAPKPEHVRQPGHVKQPVVKQPVVQPDVVKQPEIKPARPLNDVDAFKAQFQAVGAELKAAASAQPNVFADLDDKYHRITFGDAVSTQAKRDAAAKLLVEIHDDIIARKKP